MEEWIYLSIKSPKDSRTLKWALDSSHKWLASFGQLYFATLATFGLRSWAPLDKILDPHLHLLLYKRINYLHKLVLLVCWPDHNSCRIAPPHHPDRSSRGTADKAWLPGRACNYQVGTHCTVFVLSTLQKKLNNTVKVFLCDIDIHSKR